MKNFSFVLATDKSGGLGKNGTLAWHIPEDMKFFKELTTKTKDGEKINAVVMGKYTWFSIPDKYRPLPSRKNIVLSKTIKNIDGAELYADFDSALNQLSHDSKIENIYIIGGAQLYNSLLNNKYLENIYLTQIDEDYGCDVFFEGVPSSFNEVTDISSFKHNNNNIKISKFSKKTPS